MGWVEVHGGRGSAGCSWRSWRSFSLKLRGVACLLGVGECSGGRVWLLSTRCWLCLQFLPDHDCIEGDAVFYSIMMQCSLDDDAVFYSMIINSDAFNKIFKMSTRWVAETQRVRGGASQQTSSRGRPGCQGAIASSLRAACAVLAGAGLANQRLGWAHTTTAASIADTVSSRCALESPNCSSW